MAVVVGHLSQQEQVEAGLKLAGTSAVILAPREALDETLARLLLSQHRVAGIIDVHKQGTLCLEFPARVGRWTTADRSCWELPQVTANTVLFLGAAEEIGGRMLLTAARHGISRFVYVSSGPLDFKRRRVWPVLGYRLGRSLLHALRRSLLHALKRLVRPVVIAAYDKLVSTISHHQAFRELRRSSRAVKLPKEAFDQRKLLLTIGSLQPGGAERQFCYTASGLAFQSDFDVSVHVLYLEPPRDFFKDKIENCGLEVQLMDLSPQALANGKKTPNPFRRVPWDFPAVAREVMAYVNLFRRERPALVHAWLDACAIPAAIAAQIVGVPGVIISCRSCAPTNFTFHQPYMKPGYLSLLADGSVILLNNSRAGAEDYARWLGIEANRFKIVHNGFDFPDRPPPEASRAIRRDLGIPEEFSRHRQHPPLL